MILSTVFKPLEHQVELELYDVTPLLYLYDGLQCSGDVHTDGENLIVHLSSALSLIIINGSFGKHEEK